MVTGTRQVHKRSDVRNAIPRVCLQLESVGEQQGVRSVPREAKKVGKITRPCDYRYREGRVTWDYREAGDGAGSARRDDEFGYWRNDRIDVQVRR